MKRVINLCDDGSTEAHKTFQQPQHNPSAFGEVLDAGDERARARKGLRVRTDPYIEAHLPHGGPCDPARDRGPYHEVAGQVHGGADGEDHPRRGDLVDEARDYAEIAAQVLGEADEVEGCLVVAECGLDGARVGAEQVGGAVHRHYQQRREYCEPSAPCHVPPKRPLLFAEATNFSHLSKKCF